MKIFKNLKKISLVKVNLAVLQISRTIINFGKSGKEVDFLMILVLDVNKFAIKKYFT